MIIIQNCIKYVTVGLNNMLVLYIYNNSYYYAYCFIGLSFD